MLVSPVAPIAKRSAWGSAVFSLCMGSEAMPCWKRRRCCQGEALWELFCRRSLHGGSWADHLCCIIWAQPAEEVLSACFCTGSCTVSIKPDYECQKKCSLFSHPLTNPKLSVKRITEPKRSDHLTATYRAKKVSELHPSGMERWEQGCISWKTYSLVRNGHG